MREVFRRVLGRPRGKDAVQIDAFRLQQQLANIFSNRGDAEVVEFLQAFWVQILCLIVNDKNPRRQEGPPI